MQKLQTIYKLTEDIRLIQHEEDEDKVICLIEYGEPCSGILRHWDTKENIIKELKEIISKLENYEQKL